MCNHLTLRCTECGEEGTAAHFMGKQKKTPSDKATKARQENGKKGGKPRKVGKPE